jgi:hypothetical protein
MWAWPERPDMRSYGHQPPEGQRLVLLKLQVPGEKVLLSDFGDWHMVLNDGYHPTPEEDADDAFYESGTWDRLTADLAAKRASWERVFDLQPGDRLQACIDAPQVAWVVSFAFFKGRSRGRKRT